MVYKRSYFNELCKKLREQRRFIQVLSGPRQAGKTTLIEQTFESLGVPYIYASADAPTLKDRIWLEQQWELARIKADESPQGACLFLDEIQKVSGWSEVVKKLWDEDTLLKRKLKVVLTGSSLLLIQMGLSESLTGRFEIIAIPHWSYAEMKDAFGWSLETFLYFGGYPGVASLVSDEKRWHQYVVHSIMETTLSRDVLLLHRVDKPVLLRRLFQLGCDYSGQILSYQKMLGQLQEAGNTTTLAHYLDLLSQCGMVAGLQKFSGRRIKQRSSSPKLQVYNTALLTAASGLSFAEAKAKRDFWGRLVESAVGAHLLNTTCGTSAEVFYWRHVHHEVDFVIKRGETLATIEVKSGRKKDTFSGMDSFDRQFRPAKKLLVGTGGIPLEEFLKRPCLDWL